MTFDEDKLKELLAKYELGTCTHEEKVWLEDWYAQQTEKGEWTWTKQEKEAFRSQLQDQIWERANIPPIPNKTINLRWYWVAACILAVAAGALWFGPSFNDDQPLAGTKQAVVEDVPPGADGAILTLASGETIVLDSAGNGLLANEQGVTISLKNGSITYADEKTQPDAPLVYNTISTPNGRQYNIELSDGTMVWLNAGSSLRFPAGFKKESREVYIQGEVFFEVAKLVHKNQPVPFTVFVTSNATQNAYIEVTGTAFNVRSYEDEPHIQTTLVEGAVSFTAHQQTDRMKPGQQVELNHADHKRKVKLVDTDVVSAWKSGYFSFDKSDIEDVMKQISRWYDIEVSYENGIVPREKFWGEISRKTTLNDVLKVLELSGVKFKLDGKKLIVLK